MPKKGAAPPRRYPSHEELPELIARRRQLADRLVLSMVLSQEDEAAADRLMEELIREHGRPEIARMMARLAETFDRAEDAVIEKAQIYAIYVRSWRRFGGEQPLLSTEEHLRLLNERADLVGKELLEEQELSDEERRRISELGDQIFAEPHLWDDLVPPNPPREVAPDGAPPLAKERPGRNEPCWCGSGRKYKHCHLRADEQSGL
jgi:hypothetical protein